MPLAAHLNVQVITDLNDAIAAHLHAHPGRGREIGGILLGTIEYPSPSHPIVRIERLDPVESEYRREASYDLSDRDKKVLGKKLAWWNQHGSAGNLRPVGFYRSHTRRGLYLDNDDFLLLQNYFPEPYAVVLLVRPEAGAASVGGFFFWEDGDMHRESSYQEFPFDAARLPLVGQPAPPAPVPPPPRPPRPVPLGMRIAIPLAVGAALGVGLYAVATSRVSRTLPPVPPAIQRAAKPAPAVAAVPPVPTSAPTLPPIEKPSPFQPKTRSAAKAPPATAIRQPAPSPSGSAARTEAAPSTPVVPSLRAPEPVPAIAAAPAPPPLAPITTPVRIEQPRPVRHATVTVEPVSGSKFGRVVRHIPGLGRLGKRNKGFVPARAIRQITPAVPSDEHLAHDVPVDVKITVDLAGNVASVDSRGADRQLARLAADAARNWQFIPARHNEETVSSELILHFMFKGPTSAEP